MVRMEDVCRIEAPHPKVFIETETCLSCPFLRIFYRLPHQAVWSFSSFSLEVMDMCFLQGYHSLLLLVLMVCFGLSNFYLIGTFLDFELCSSRMRFLVNILAIRRNGLGILAILL